MDDRREGRAFAVVLLVIGMVAATTITSCGGGGSDGDSNGALCEQCGDTDGPCQPAVVASGDDRPSGCTSDPCTIELRCTRKVDSGQRRCFPVDPSTDQLDFRYECDGSRPIQSFAPTLTPSATPTFTPSPVLSPTSTGPTATGATPAATATPTASATPTGPEDSTVTITVTQPSGNDLPAVFAVTVLYPSSKGNFLFEGTPDCDEGDFSIQDNGAGTLLLSFTGDPDFTGDTTDQDCTFHQTSGTQLRANELNGTAPGLRVTFDVN